MLTLGLKSLLNRRFVSSLTVVSIALSVCLIIGVERLRSEARAGFANSASGIDLIVASRGNPVQILLATVFGVGSTSNAITWETFEAVRENDATAWAVPISMGDNHRGYPVIGTSPQYFTHFRHSGGEALKFAAGRAFSNGAEAVLGAEVAHQFAYAMGDEIVLAHGAGDVAFHVHDKSPFTVVGLLDATGTAVDRMVFVSLRGFDALHSDRPDKRADPRDILLGVHQKPGRESASGHDAHADEYGHDAPDDDPHEDDPHHGVHEPAGTHAHDEPQAKQINAIYLGLRDRAAALGLQRYFAEYKAEPLTAVMPNVALLELWSLTGTAEAALGLMAVAVALAGLLGLLATLSAALESRRREFSVLRSVGATPRRIFALIVLEAAILTMAGLVLGYIALQVVISFFEQELAREFGLRISRSWPSSMEWMLMLTVLAAGLVASLIPAFRVFRITLADGLSSKL